LHAVATIHRLLMKTIQIRLQADLPAEHDAPLFDRVQVVERGTRRTRAGAVATSDANSANAGIIDRALGCRSARPRQVR
jgi:hypothetical protein